MGTGTLRKRGARSDADPGSRAASRRAVTSTNGSQTAGSAHILFLSSMRRHDKDATVSRARPSSPVRTGWHALFVHLPKSYQVGSGRGGRHGGGWVGAWGDVFLGAVHLEDQ